MTTPITPPPADTDAIRARFELTGVQCENTNEYLKRLYASSRDVPALLTELDQLRAELEKVTAERDEADRLSEKLTLTIRAFPHADNAANIAHARAQRDAACANTDRLREELVRAKSALETARVYGGDVARQLAAARADADKLRSLIDAARALHSRVQHGICVHCSVLADSDVSWPCRTLRTLEAADATPTAAPQPDEPSLSVSRLDADRAYPTPFMPYVPWRDRDGTEYMIAPRYAAPDAVAGTGQQDPEPSSVPCPHCLAGKGERCFGYGIAPGMFHSGRRYALLKLGTAAAVPPAADKADGSKA
jgi:hypothetical protein